MAKPGGLERFTRDGSGSTGLIPALRVTSHDHIVDAEVIGKAKARWEQLVRGVRRLFRFLCKVSSPLEPILSEYLSRVLRAFRAVSTLQRIGRTVLVASPTDSFRVFGILGKFFCHFSLEPRPSTRAWARLVWFNKINFVFQ